MRRLLSLRLVVLLALCLSPIAWSAPITEERCQKYSGLAGAVPLTKLQADLGPPTAIVRGDAEADAASEKYRAVVMLLFPDPHLLYVTPTQIFIFIQDSSGRCQYSGSTRVYSKAEFDKLKADAKQSKDTRAQHTWASRCSGVGVSNGVAAVQIDQKTDPYLSKIAQYFYDRGERQVKGKPTDSELLQVFGSAPSQVLSPHGRYTGPAAQLQDYLRGVWSLDSAQKVQVYRHPKVSGVIYVLLVGPKSVWGGGIGAPPGY